MSKKITKNDEILIRKILRIFLANLANRSHFFPSIIDSEMLESSCR